MLFFIKKAKLLKNGEASVCMRITVNGVRVENNIRKSIEPALWNQAKECAKGKSRKSCDLNAYIEDARIKLHQTFNELEEQGQFITARLLQKSSSDKTKHRKLSVHLFKLSKNITTNAVNLSERTMPLLPSAVMRAASVTLLNLSN